MQFQDVLLEIHRRTHRSLGALLAHCGQLSAEELLRELPGFGYPSIQLQIHHVIGAEQYWTAVLQGRIEADDNAPDYPDIDALEAFRMEISSATEQWLRGASDDDWHTPRSMMTWGNKEQMLTPAHVFLRTQMHAFQHQGQITAMCRIIGKPVGGLDYPVD